MPPKKIFKYKPFTHNLVPQYKIFSPEIMCTDWLHTTLYTRILATLQHFFESNQVEISVNADSLDLVASFPYLGRTVTY